MDQAAYNIGGHTISADTIQTTILGCRMSRPGQVNVTPLTIFFNLHVVEAACIYIS